MASRLTSTTRLNTAFRSDFKVILAACLQRLGRTHDSLAEYGRAVQLLQPLGDRAGLVSVYLRIGALHFKLEDFAAARLAYTNAVNYSSCLKTLARERVEALMYLGTTLVRLGEHDEAIATYRKAFEASQSAAGLEHRGRIALGLGKALFQVGQTEESLKWTQDTVDLLTQARSPDRVLALHNLAAMRAANGDGHEALRVFVECLSIYRAQGRIDKQASVLEEMALHWLRLGDRLKSKTTCQEALELLEGQDNGELSGRLYRLLGILLHLEAHSEDERFCAHGFVRMSCDIFRSMKSMKEAALSHEVAGVLRLRPDVPDLAERLVRLHCALASTPPAVPSAR